jgi:hypothetical protein
MVQRVSSLFHVSVEPQSLLQPDVPSLKLCPTIEQDGTWPINYLLRLGLTCDGLNGLYVKLAAGFDQLRRSSILVFPNLIATNTIDDEYLTTIQRWISGCVHEHTLR